jgi:hypothetical protein
MSNNETASNGHKYSRRSSKVQKDMITAVNNLLDKDFIIYNYNGETKTTGFNKVFRSFVENTKLFNDLRSFLSKDGPCSRDLYDVFVSQKLFEDVKDETLRSSLYAFFWERIFSLKGTQQINENAERQAYIRLVPKLGENIKAQTDLIRQHAYNMLEPENCIDYVVAIMVACKVFNNSSGVYYSFFQFVDSLKGQLCDTISMNLSVQKDMSIQQEIVELFVRNQLMLFSKKNHSASASQPTITAETANAPHLSSVEDLQEYMVQCYDELQKVNKSITGICKAISALEKTVNEKISLSEEDTVKKTELRKFLNEKLKELGSEYHVKNSRDIVLCRILNFLGDKYNFSVRGTFRYPLGGISVAGSSVRSKPQIAKVNLTDPHAIIAAFDERIKETRESLRELENQKRAYMENPAVKQSSKRQRVQKDAAVENASQMEGLSDSW